MIYDALKKAFRGRRLWKKLCKKYGDGSTNKKYLMFSDEDIDYSVIGLFYLDEYIRENKIREVIPVFTDSTMVQYLSLLVQNQTIISETIVITPKEMECLMKYYVLVNMSESWLSISVKKPYDTYAEHLLGHHGVTKRDLICYDVYRFDKVPAISLRDAKSDPFVAKIIEKYNLGVSGAF